MRGRKEIAALAAVDRPDGPPETRRHRQEGFDPASSRCSPLAPLIDPGRPRTHRINGIP
jgi:hypothetical protein